MTVIPCSPPITAYLGFEESVVIRTWRKVVSGSRKASTALDTEILGSERQGAKFSPIAVITVLKVGSNPRSLHSIGLQAAGAVEGPPAKRTKGGGRKRKSPDAGATTAGKCTSMLSGDNSAGKAGLASLLNSKNMGSRCLPSLLLLPFHRGRV